MLGATYDIVTVGGGLGGSALAKAMAERGAPAVVEFDSGGATESVSARLVVGADDRSSSVRKWGNFAVKHDPERLLMAGVLLEGGKNYREDAAYLMINSAISQGSFVAPQSDRRFRATRASCAIRCSPTRTGIAPVTLMRSSTTATIARCIHGKTG
jgi:flavin-dependent dehydrogenase